MLKHTLTILLIFKIQKSMTKLDRFMKTQKNILNKSDRQSFKRPSKCQVCGETRHVNGCVNRKLLGSVNMIAEETRQVTARGWFLDYRATLHVCNTRDKFVTYHQVRDGNKVVMSNGERSNKI